MAQGERLRGALRQDPNMQNLQRVSPGVYKNAQGQIVKPAGGRLPSGASTMNRAGNRAPEYNPQAMQQMAQAFRHTKPMDRGFSQQSQNPNSVQQASMGRPNLNQNGMQNWQPLTALPFGQNFSAAMSQQQQYNPDLAAGARAQYLAQQQSGQPSDQSTLSQQQFQPQQLNQFQLPDIQSGMYHAPQSVPMNQIPGFEQTGNVPPMNWNQGVPLGQYKPMIKY